MTKKNKCEEGSRTRSSSGNKENFTNMYESFANIGEATVEKSLTNVLPIDNDDFITQDTIEHEYHTYVGETCYFIHTNDKVYYNCRYSNDKLNKELHLRIEVKEFDQQHDSVVTYDAARNTIDIIFPNKHLDGYFEDITIQPTTRGDVVLILNSYYVYADPQAIKVIKENTSNAKVEYPKEGRYRELNKSVTAKEGFEIREPNPKQMMNQLLDRAIIFFTICVCIYLISQFVMDFKN